MSGKFKRPSTENHTKSDGMLRREFLGSLGIGAASLLGGASLLSASRYAVGSEAKSIEWANWPLSVDTDNKGNIPSLMKFKQMTGIDVKYNAVINDNNTYYAKIKPIMEQKSPIGAAVMSPSGWMADVMIQSGWVQKLDKDKLPHASKNILDLDIFTNPVFDPDRSFTMPWQGWLAGIAVNTSVTGRPVESLEDFFTSKDLKGRVAVLNELYETMGLMLLYSGYDPANFTDDQFQVAIDRLKKARTDRQIIRVTGNNYAPALSRGNIAACFAWAGDVIQLHRDNPNIQYFIPAEGAILNQDELMIPKYISDSDTEIAYKLIDYYFRPDVAAEVDSYVNAVCPVKGAKKAMEKINPKLVMNQLIFPGQEQRKKFHGFKSMSLVELNAHQKLFESALGL